MPDRITGQAWDRAFRTFSRSAWRWECQGVYHEPYEDAPLRQFLGGEQPDLSYMDEWLADVHADTQAGKTYGRVRMLTEPLTDYLRFELSFTHLNIEAGEDIRVITESRVTELDLPREDFWLFDDDHTLLMHLDDSGFIYADLITDRTELDRFREIRDRAWQNAVPFSEYLTSR